jgi:hypothetical protein
MLLPIDVGRNKPEDRSPTQDLHLGLDSFAPLGLILLRLIAMASSVLICSQIGMRCYA